jgi:hypothetical protein
MNPTDLLSQVRWRPEIGDPSVMGWVTVAAYGAAAALCFIAARRCLADDDPGQGRRRCAVWLGVTVLMLFLGLNKQLDLQSLLTDIGRVLARRDGWYGQRRAVQRWFVLAAAATGVTGLAVMVWKSRAVLRERLSLLIGLSLLVTFVIIRAASFHHVDVLIHSRVLGLRINWILELGGIFLIGYGAARSIRRPPAQ